jgi:WD40 repeat protein
LQAAAAPQTPVPIQLSPHSNGKAIVEARKALKLSAVEVAVRSGGAFDAVWLKAAEEGARVDARQLATLARLLSLQPDDISYKEDTRSPYRGLMAFEPEDASLFGGREVATKAILALLKEHPIVAVIGASGSGKSSVVKAGVVPALRDRQAPPWRGLIMRPGSDPLLALARALGSEIDRGTDEDARIATARKRAGKLRYGDTKLSDYFARIVELQTKDGIAPRLLLFVDQWEELYTQTSDAADRRIFLDLLLEEFVEDSPHRLILTMRADFTGHLLEDSRNFADASNPGTFLLPRMTREEIAEAIRKPANAVGYTADDNLVAMVLDDAGDEPGVLALVEFSLTELWPARDQNTKRLTLEAYVKLGGLKGSIDRHADGVFEQLNPEQQSAARRALTRLVHVSTLDSYTRLRRSLSDFDPAGLKVIQALARNRLVVISHDEGRQDDVAEVAHEALIREWRKLREWVAADPGFLQWQEEVERKMRRHADNGLRDEDLLKGTDLEEALSYQRTRTSDVPSPVDTFITASQANKQKLVHEREADLNRLRQVELDRETQKAVASRRFARWAAFAALLLAAMGIGVGMQYRSAVVATNDAKHQAGIAEAQREIAEENRAKAEIEQQRADAQSRSSLANETRALSALGQIALQEDRSVDALWLSLAAWPRANEDGRPQLSSVLNTISKAIASESMPKRLMEHGDAVIGVLLMSEGRILSWSKDKSLRLWDTETGQQIGPPMLHDAEVVGALVMRNGRILSWSYDETLRMWDPETGDQIGPAMQHESFVTGALVMPNGRILSWSYDFTLRLWDPNTGIQFGQTMRHADAVIGALVVPDGRILSWSHDYTLRLWDPNSGAQVGLAMEHERSVNGARVMPDGRILSWSDDSTLRIWNLDSGEQVGPAIQHDKSVSQALVMTNGRILSWSSSGVQLSDGPPRPFSPGDELRLWDPDTREQIGPSMRHDGPVSGALVVANRHILSWSADGAMLLWDPDTGAPIGPAMRHEDAVNGAVEMTDGRILSWSHDKTLRQWDPDTGAQIGPAMRHNNGVIGALKMPDGRILSWAKDHTIRLWDPSVGAHVGSTMRHKNAVRGALLMPSARILSWSSDATLRMWDPTTGAQIGPEMRHDSYVLGAYLMPDGRVLSWSHDDSLRLWDPGSGAQIGPAMSHETTMSDSISSMISGGVKGANLMPDGHVLSWAGDMTLRLWDPNTGAQIGRAMRHGDGVVGALVMPDGRILSWSDDETLRLWDPKSGTQIGPPMRHDDDVVGALVLRNGRILSWSYDKTLRFWDSKTNTQVGPAMLHENRVVGASLMASARILTWSDDNSLRIWDPATGEQIGPAMHHDGPVVGAFVMTNGRILSWSVDNTVRVWDADSGVQVGPAMRHDNTVLGVRILRNGRIVSWSDDKTLRLWDLNTSMQIGPSMRHDGSVEGAAVMPDGRILSWSSDNTLRFWKSNWPTGTLFEISCSLLAGVNSESSDISTQYGIAITEAVCEDPDGIPLPDWKTLEYGLLAE